MQQKREIETVFIDANIWVSAFINPSGYPAKLIDLWIKRKFKAVISLPLIKEIKDVLKKPRLQEKYAYKDSEIEKYLTLIASEARIVKISGDVSICRDLRDNHILEAALKGRAKYLITRDDDIKGDSDVIQRMNRLSVKVVTVANFLKLHKVTADREITRDTEPV